MIRPQTLWDQGVSKRNDRHDHKQLKEYGFLVYPPFHAVSWMGYEKDK